MKSKPVPVLLLEARLTPRLLADLCKKAKQSRDRAPELKSIILDELLRLPLRPSIPPVTDEPKHIQEIRKKASELSTLLEALKADTSEEHFSPSYYSDVMEVTALNHERYKHLSDNPPLPILIGTFPYLPKWMQQPEGNRSCFDPVLSELAWLEEIAAEAENYFAPRIKDQKKHKGNLRDKDMVILAARTFHVFTGQEANLHYSGPRNIIYGTGAPFIKALLHSLGVARNDKSIWSDFKSSYVPVKNLPA